MPSKQDRFAVVCLTVVIALAASLLTSSRAKHFTAAAESQKMPTLQGEEAKEYLQKQNSYASLQEAMKAARYQINLEATPFAELPTALHAANPAQNFSAYFTSAGMLLAVRGDAALQTDGASAQRRDASVKRLEMRLEAIGYGEQLSGVLPAELQSSGNRVELRRGEGLVEWYENRLEGLEQGFRIAAPPGERIDGAALRLKLAISGELKAEMEEGSNSVTFRDGDHLLSYDGLKVYDARGLELKGQMKVTQEAVWLEVDERDAAYPLTIDPIFSEQQKLTAPDGGTVDEFGNAIAISGETVVVGAVGDSVDFITGRGSAYVFVRSGAVCSMQQKLTAADGAENDSFGYSVAIRGETVVVGAPDFLAGPTQGQGSVHVFVRVGAVWSLQQKLTAADGATGDSFGISVDISGETVVVGAYIDDVGSNENQGSAYVFVRAGTVWSQQQKLNATDSTEFDLFGTSVGISGETAVISAPADRVGLNSNQGSAYVFVRAGAVWSQQQKLTAADGAATDALGQSVAISGETVVVGTGLANVGANANQGAAYVFVRVGALWSQQQKLTAGDGAADDRFGNAVTISGETVVVGASLANVGANANQGSAYVFVRAGAIWSQQQKLTASDGAGGDQFGTSVAISGETVVVGARRDSVGLNSFQGSAYVFAITAPTITATPLSRSAGGPSANSQIATVNDSEAAENPLTVTVNGGVSATVTGVTVSGTHVSAAGVVTADVVAACGAATASFTLRVTDTNGLFSEAMLTVTVTPDNQPPTISCPANITTSTTTNMCKATVRYNAPTVSDNCSGVGSPSCTPASGSDFTKGTTTVNCSVSDAASNSASCSFTVTVNDTQPPTISCPANITANTDNNQCQTAVTYTTPTATDNCDGTRSVTCSPASGSTFPKGLTTVTCTATDTVSNTGTCTFTVTVTDNVAPVFTGCSNVSANTASNSCNAVVNYTLPTANDNCDGARSVTCTPASGATFPKGTTTVSCSASDTVPNTGTCSFTVTVTDNVAPVLSGCTNLSANTAPNACNASVNYTQPTATDNCDGTRSVTCSPTSGSAFPKGVTTVTCTATDTVPNTGTCTFTVTVTDNVAPVLTGCTNVSANTASNSCDAVVNYTLPIANDNCDGTRSVTCSPTPGSIFPKGVTTVTCTATDTVSNTGTCTFTVTVTDVTPPAINCPANIVKGTDANQCSAVTTFSPTATDNCSGVGTVACTPLSGSTFPKGTTTVNCSVIDASGNSAGCSFTVTVSDTQAPAIVCPANISLPAATGYCSAVVTYAAPAVSDNCPGVGAPSCSPASGSTFPKGATTVNCSVLDAAGNSRACSFTVTVLDTQAPSIACPANIVANTVNAGDETVVVNFAAPVASDNCPGVSVGCVPPSGSQFPKGTTTVACTATDTSNNKTSCTFTVSVFDYVIVDDANGKILRFILSTGQYDFFDCRKGTSLSGQGQVTVYFCKVELRDTGANPRSPDRNVFALANPCTKIGMASITYAGVTSTLNDTNMSNNINRCP